MLLFGDWTPGSRKSDAIPHRITAGELIEFPQTVVDHAASAADHVRKISDRSMPELVGFDGGITPPIFLRERPENTSHSNFDLRRVHSRKQRRHP